MDACMDEGTTGGILYIDTGARTDFCIIIAVMNIVMRIARHEDAGSLPTSQAAYSTYKLGFGRGNFSFLSYIPLAADS